MEPFWFQVRHVLQVLDILDDDWTSPTPLLVAATNTPLQQRHLVHQLVNQLVLVAYPFLWEGVLSL